MEILSDCDFILYYYLRKENVVAATLCRKKRRYYFYYGGERVVFIRFGNILYFSGLRNEQEDVDTILDK